MNKRLGTNDERIANERRTRTFVLSGAQLRKVREDPQGSSDRRRSRYANPEAPLSIPEDARVEEIRRRPHRCESPAKLREPLRLSKTKPARADCDYLHSSGLMLGQLSSSYAEVAGQIMRICHCSLFLGGA